MMDLSSLMGDNTRQSEKAPDMEYEAQISSSIINEDIKITIGENGLNIKSPLDILEIPFAYINAISFTNYAITLDTEEEKYTLSRMGSWCEPFYTALSEGFNKAVLKGLFVKGSPIIKAKGEYSYKENQTQNKGNGEIEVYENCIVILTPNLETRRIPLCFINKIDKNEYQLTLTLNTGEEYSILKMGYDYNPVVEAIEAQLIKLRENALICVKEIDTSLGGNDASKLAKLMPQGVAAKIGDIQRNAPSFLSALEGEIAKTRIKDTFNLLKKLCNPDEIYIGLKKNEIAKEENADIAGLAGGGLEALTSGLASGLGSIGNIPTSLNMQESSEDEQLPPDPYLFYIIAASRDNKYAAVEFSKADCATFVYKTQDENNIISPESFCLQINRALEAVDFAREVIRLSDADLKKRDNIDYYMANKRTEALRFVRSNFEGRIVHTNISSWEKKLLELWGGKTKPEINTTPINSRAFCKNCGNAIDANVKFCGSCGHKV